MDRPLALVIDSDPAVHADVRKALEKHEILIEGASNGRETMKALDSRPVRLIVGDLDTPGVDARAVVSYAARCDPLAPIVALASSERDVDVESLVGRTAFDVLCKPVDPRRLDLVIRRVKLHITLLEDLRALRENLQSRDGLHGIVGRSPQCERVRQSVTRLAVSESPVWFWGEPGTGKKLAGRTLHRQSNRAGSAFAILQCAGLSARPWRTQLGVDASDTPLAGGVLAKLEGGTVYLEDLPALDPGFQTKLLSVFRPADGAGGNIRVLASSTVDPQSLVEEGRIPESIHARLASERVFVPPLRERAEDIPLLARHFIAAICAINQLPAMQLAPDALQLLERHRWEDNVRGLRDAMEQAVLLSHDERIRSSDLPDAVRESGAGASVGAPGRGPLLPSFREAKRDVVERFERSYLGDLMRRHGGNVTAAAQQAGMLRSALQRLLRKHGLRSAEFRRKHRAPVPEGVTRPRH